jgi:hypothetical protein
MLDQKSEDLQAGAVGDGAAGAPEGGVQRKRRGHEAHFAKCAEVRPARLPTDLRAALVSNGELRLGRFAMRGSSVNYSRMPNDFAVPARWAGRDDEAALQSRAERLPAELRAPRVSLEERSFLRGYTASLALSLQKGG